MKPLSPIKFFKGSMLKMLPMAVTVCLGVAILYFMAMFVQQMDNQIHANFLYPMQNISQITSGSSGIKPEDANVLESNIDSSRYFYAQCEDVMFYMAVGSSSTILALAQQEDILKVMDTLNLKLVDGKMPVSPMEVILHKQIAANHGLEVGSIVEKGQRGWRTDSDVKVVGLLDGRAVYSLGIQESSLLNPETPNISLVVLSEDEQLYETNEFLEENFAGEYNLFTYEMVKNLLQAVQGSLDALKTFVGIVLVLVLAVFLVNITSIQYSIRKKELEMLHAIGYTRKYIIKKSFIEIGTSGLIGYLCGIALAVAICWVINVYSWSEIGLTLPLFSLGTILTMLLVPVAITLFSMIAPLRMTKFRDIA